MLVGSGDRVGYLLQFPWVTRLDSSPGPCQGATHSPIRPCKNTAWFHYQAAHPDEPDCYGETGDYCWAHVVAQLNADYYRKGAS